jgi:hypothetical protein
MFRMMTLLMHNDLFAQGMTLPAGSVPALRPAAGMDAGSVAAARWRDGGLSAFGGDVAQVITSGNAVGFGRIGDGSPEGGIAIMLPGSKGSEVLGAVYQSEQSHDGGRLRGGYPTQ